MCSSLRRILWISLLMSPLACGRDHDALSPDWRESGADVAEIGSDVAPSDGFTYELYAWDGQDPGTSVLRWKGTADGPSAESPEQSDRPFLGFGRPYFLRWSITLDDGLVVGHRYRASQTDPTAILSAPGLDVGDVAQFAFANSTPAESLPSGGCDSGPDCPDQLRFASGGYDFQVFALDVLGATRTYSPGILDFEVNYPPESSVVLDEDWPQYTVADGHGGWITARFAAGDTIPVGSYVTMRMDGYDRLEGSVSNPDSFCCDQKLDPSAPDVRFQGQVKLTGDEGFRVRRFQSLFSDSDPADTLGFWAGPFAYEFLARTVDEHGRRDSTPDAVEFVTGFRPRVLDLQPSGGRSMVLRNPLDGSPWPENEVPYDTPSNSLTRYWDGLRFWDQPGSGRAEVHGYLFRLKLRFEGAADPREPSTAVAAWAYSLVSEHDPDNSIINGCCESSDLSFYVDSPQDDVWAFSNADAVEVFVPIEMWYAPELFDPGSANETSRQIGEWLRRNLGASTLRVVGRTTRQGDTFKLHVGVRPGTPYVPIDIAGLGRRSDVAEVHFSIHLGLDPTGTGSIQRMWPDY